MMASHSIYSQSIEDCFSQAEAELLSAILQPESDNYPWNPTSESDEAYFIELEQGFEFEDLSDLEIRSRSQTLFSQLNACFPPTTPTTLRVSLCQRFAGVPESLLDAIAHKTQQIISTNLTLAEQLMQVAIELLPDWEEEDLLVFARRLAYPMRDIIEEPDILPKDWNQLSPIEQAKWSMACAQYALEQLHESASD